MIGKTFFKHREDCDEEELKKKQKYESVLYIIIWFVALGVFALSTYIYFKTRIIGLPILGATYSVILALLAMDSLESKRNLSLFIYLKRRENK